jgi:uncharacterized membrane protein YkvA (DUF1232 family)
MPERLETWRAKARQLKLETYALYLAYRDPRTPWVARLVALCVAGYAFSPIDLIPDPIPVLGYLDDLVILPLGVLLALKLVPGEVMVDCRRKAEEAFAEKKPVSWGAAAIFILLWLLTAGWVVIGVYQLLN